MVIAKIDVKRMKNRNNLINKNTMKKIFFFLICSALAYSCSRQTQTLSSENTLSDAEKIVGLSRCWSEAKYNFVYFDKLNFDWDSLYQATIPIVLDTKNDFEYFRELQRFVAALQDGHTNVSWDRRDLWDNWATIPITTRLIDGKMIVIGVLNNELEQLQGIKRGLEIVKINGIDVHEYVSTHIKPFVFSSTEQWLNLIAYGREATRGKRSESIRLTFKDENNNIFESTISRSMFENDLPPKPIFDFTILEHNIGLLKIYDFWRDDFTTHFDSIYEKILATNGLIIDIRGNGGGSSNNSEYVLSHLTNENFNMSVWSSPYYIPAFASWNRPREWHIGEPWIGQPVRNKPFYNKPIALLIDESTFSAAEDFCVGFRNMKRGTIIGTPSGGSTGNPIGFDLPGGGSVQICTKKDTYPDGTEFVGVGILPDVEVQETVSSFLSKSETGIDNSNTTRKAIEVLKSSMKIE
jgi:Periplasmic protease